MSPLHGPVQTCSLGTPLPWPHMETSSSPPDLLKLVYYVAHTSTGKGVVTFD